MDKFAAMTVFVKTVETGSFTAAAEALSMSSQAVGKQIAALEAHLGLHLIQRTTRRQRLTEAGRQFHERCQIILEELKAAENLVAVARGRPSGLLRLNAPISYGTHRLAPLLPEYLRRHPDVRIDLRLSNRVVDLIEEGYDAVFRIGTLPDSSLIARPLAPYRLVVCASPAYLKAAPPLHEPRDLQHHECLIFSHAVLQKVWRFSSRTGNISVPVQGRLQIDDNEALLNAALAGQGIVMQPEESLARYLADGRLSPVLTDYPVPTVPLHLLHAPDRRMTPKLRSFIEFVAERLS